MNTKTRKGAKQSKLKPQTASPVELVDHIRSKGFQLYIQNEKLCISPRSLNSRQKAFMEQYKDKLLIGFILKEMKDTDELLDSYLKKVSNLQDKINLLELETLLYGTKVSQSTIFGNSKIDQELLKKIRMLCHPDKHAQSQLSVSVTKEINNLM